MAYITNNERGAYGQLKCSNCLIDTTRRRVKISDFGLWKFKSDQYGVLRIFSPEKGMGVEMPDI